MHHKLKTRRDFLANGFRNKSVVVAKVQVIKVVFCLRARHVTKFDNVFIAHGNSQVCRFKPGTLACRTHVATQHFCKVCAHSFGRSFVKFFEDNGSQALKGCLPLGIAAVERAVAYIDFSVAKAVNKRFSRFGR